VPAAAPVEIVHSPLSRTTTTAVAIAAAMDVASAAQGPGAPAVPLRAEAGFMEIAQGAWEGLPSTEISARYGDTLAAWRRRPWETVAPGGETLQAVVARVRPALASTLTLLAHGREAGTLDRSHVAGYGDVAPDHPWSVLVGHDGVFKVALLTLFDLPPERFWMWSMDLCGLTVVEFRAGRPVLRAHNLTDHLAALQLAASTGAAPPANRPDGAL
jgi:broad specificity phosphatase PhoE